MEKLQKPRFFSVNNWINLIGLIGGITGIIQFFIPENVWKLKFKLITGFSIFFVCGIMYFILYLLSVNKFYKEYLKLYEQYDDLQKRHIALSEQYDKKIQIIFDKDNLISEYKYITAQMMNRISAEALNVNDYEKKFLENLYKITYIDIEHLGNIEGGNKNGRNF